MNLDGNCIAKLLTSTKESWQQCKTMALVCEGLVEGSTYKFSLTAQVIDADGEAVVSSSESVSQSAVFNKFL